MVVHTVLTRLLRSDRPLVVVECPGAAQRLRHKLTIERMFDALVGGQLL